MNDQISLDETNQEKPVPEIVDHNVAKLISAGAALAANCEPCLNQAVLDLQAVGVTNAEIRGAVEIAQFVKDKPADLLKGAADLLTGSRLSEEPDSKACPADKMEKGTSYNLTMLIAAGAAMAANCEPCLNQIVPNLIEAGVADADIRKAVEIGQTVKDQAASQMKEAADILTGTRLSEKPISEGWPADEMRQVSSCCA